MKKPSVSVLVTDCDNTLFDWVEIWCSSFPPMLEALVRLSGVARDVLIREIKAIHQRYGTSEYAFVIPELPSLRRLHPGADLQAIYATAIDAYREGRSRSMKLYPGVRETLERIKSTGAKVVAYTESLGFYSAHRLKMLGLEGLLDILYSPPDHPWPQRGAPSRALENTEHRHVPAGEAKPSPRILLDIIADVGARPDQCVYVGDSLVKDIAMANDAGVACAHARYGVAHDRPGYELLRAVTHWPDRNVELERSASHARPERVLENGFAEILDYYEFTRPDATRASSREPFSGRA